MAEAVIRGTPLEQAARELWRRPSAPYLDTASYGLPPSRGWDAVASAIADWREGRIGWEHWDVSTTRARAAFARLVGVDEGRVAVGASVSQLVGLVAASLATPGRKVVAHERDFASLLFPWLVHADLGVEVVTVPLDRVADAIDGETGVVAVSAVQSLTGEVADLDGIAAAAREHGALIVVDATQACGWLPLDASKFDALVCADYKWLMSPRGAAFLVVTDAVLERVRPLAAGWYAGEDPRSTYYGPPLRLAESARRLDISPAWFSWVGAAPALEVLLELGVEAIHEHDVALANRFRRGLELPEGNSAIVSAPLAGASERLEAAGIRTSTRAGALRASFHVYNTEADVDAALDALVG